ncbi:MAG: hypothetical protein K6T30_00030 [Alicyclobacillus sp.]|nr:hypothetical protein [Alicyclobacillus sp.]
MKRERAPGRLPALFTGTAFVNFAAGASLGGWMAVSGEAWSAIAPVHAEVNRFGWLTMMIYGMTYAVLRVSAGLRPPWPWLAGLHWAAAEGGVLAAVVAAAAGGIAAAEWARALQWTAVVLRAVAPTLCLINILSAVAIRGRRPSQAPAGGSGGSSSDGSFSDGSSGWAFLRPAAAFRATDRVAQRGTDVALMLFLIGAWWSVGASWGRGPYEAVPAADVLVDYGWIAGTVFAVALHLYPRWTGHPWPMPWVVQAGQGLWLAGVVVEAVGESVWPGALPAGARLLGLALIWQAVVFLWRSLHPQAGETVLKGEAFAAARASGYNSVGSRMPAATRFAWNLAWVAAGLLGLLLLAGFDPFSFSALHLLFLAWITTLVYGVGYGLFPLVLGRSPGGRRPEGRWPARVAIGQLVCAWAGALCLAWAFALMAYPVQMRGLHPGPFTVWLAVGGSLAWAAAIGFIVLWATPPRNPAGPSGVR